MLFQWGRAYTLESEDIQEIVFPVSFPKMRYYLNGTTTYSRTVHFPREVIELLILYRGADNNFLNGFAIRTATSYIGSCTWCALGI